MVAHLVVAVQTLTKTLLKIAAGLLVLGVLGWTGGFVYWHLRITKALRTWQTPRALRVLSSTNPQDPFPVLKDAGCRALPYCVGAIDPSNDLTVNNEILALIRDCIRSPHVTFQITNHIVEQVGENAAKADADLLLKCELEKQDTEEVRATKCRRVHQWWNERGRTFHQWWRLWSSRCGE